jgi:hypothetical protein
MKKNKEKIYVLLGALKFQKIVFIAENLKFKLIDKIPSFVKLNEKLIDIYCNKNLKKANSEEEKNHIREICLKQKLYLRKEINIKQNRNYHYDENNPLNFINYLNINKKIHVRGLTNNIITIILFSTIFIVFPNLLSKELFLFIILSQLLFSFINFQCINLQNYNLERFNNERIQKLLLRKEKINKEKNLKRYLNCSKKISNLMTETNDVPTIEIARNCLDNIEEKQELLNLAIMQRKKREKLLEERKKLIEIKAASEKSSLSCNDIQSGDIIQPIKKERQNIALKKERKLK